MSEQPPPAPYALADADLLATCRIDRHRSGGPGGQHANRTASAIRLVHVDSGLSSSCADHRDQHANQRAALRQLRLTLACHLRGIADPTWLAARRNGRRLPVTAKAAGFHLVAAVALDALDACAGDLAAAAASVDISTSQLVKLFAADKRVLAAASQIRTGHALGEIVVRR